MRKINIPMHIIHIYIKHPVKVLIFRISIKFGLTKKYRPTFIQKCVLTNYLSPMFI